MIKKFGIKKGHKNHPKKRASTAFCAGPLASKKKPGLSVIGES
jgi:hypothetical protein